MTRNDSVILGANELDLSILDSPVTNDLSIQQARDSVKEDNLQDEATRLRKIIDQAKKLKSQLKFAGFNKWFVPGTVSSMDNMKKHKAFFEASKKYHQKYFSAANQIGKTTAAMYEVALHLTGLYPDHWPGIRFTHAPRIWVVGSTNETTRNILQRELVGEVGALGTGMIPKDLILKSSSKTGVSGAFDTVWIQHSSGDQATVQFKSYDQGRRAFEGEKVDVVSLDEMPDMEVYSECVRATITKNGYVMVTATPLDGLTDLVLSFYSEADFLPVGTDIPVVVQLAREDRDRQNEEKRKKGELVEDKGKRDKAVIFAGWNDAPWFTEEKKVRLLAATPPHLRQARSTGVPGDSGGLIYPLPLSDILYDDFPIPSHYKFFNALDPGWNYTAALFAAIDPDTETVYVYGEYKRGQAEPVIHSHAIKEKSKWKDAPVLIDPAGMGKSVTDGSSAFDLYRRHGLRVIRADNSVETGIAVTWELLSTGKLRIAKSLKETQREFVTYSRDDKGRIAKVNDHLMDALRYLATGTKHARFARDGIKGGSPFANIRGEVSGKKYF